MGASRWQVLRHIIFPHMIPSFFAGMRLGMTGVLLGVLLAELYVSTAGIGHFTTLFTQNFNPTKLLGLISVLAAMAIVLNEIVRRPKSTTAAGVTPGRGAFRPMAGRRHDNSLRDGPDRPGPSAMTTARNVRWRS